MPLGHSADFAQIYIRYNQASATVASAASETATPARKRPQAVPTQPTWFNGVKPLASEPYEGYELRLVKDHLVIRPALFYKEALALLGVVLVGFVGVMNKNTNWSLAKKWMEKHVSVLEEAFATVDTGSGRYLKEIDGTTYASWATGRTGIKALRITLRLKPRADIFVQLYEGIRKIIDFTYQSTQDLVQLEFLMPSTSDDEFVLGVVDKSKMSALRQDRWDINAFTTLNETKNVLPPNVALFTETNAITDQLLSNSEVGLGPWLTEGEGKEWFQSLVITDMGSNVDRPSDESVSLLTIVLYILNSLQNPSRLKTTHQRSPDDHDPSSTTRVKAQRDCPRFDPRDQPRRCIGTRQDWSRANGEIGMSTRIRFSLFADSGFVQRKRRQEIIDNAVKTYKTEMADEAKEAAAKRKRELDQKKYE